MRGHGGEEELGVGDSLEVNMGDMTSMSDYEKQKMKKDIVDENAKFWNRVHGTDKESQQACESGPVHDETTGKLLGYVEYHGQAGSQSFYPVNEDEPDAFTLADALAAARKGAAEMDTDITGRIIHF